MRLIRSQIADLVERRTVRRGPFARKLARVREEAVANLRHSLAHFLDSPKLLLEKSSAHRLDLTPSIQ